MFGHDPAESPQSEDTPFKPDNPYASAKVFAAHLVANYRKHFGLFVCAGTLYNHESSRRGMEFVTRKITETRPLLADLSRANEILGWRPQVYFAALIEMMVKADLKSLQ